MAHPNSKPAHTPGPWHMTDDGTLPITIVALDGRWKDQPGTTLAHVEPNVLRGTGDFQETLANARLIAAAPDMLAALETIAIHLARAWDRVGDDKDRSILLARAEVTAAIAKAR